MGKLHLIFGKPQSGKSTYIVDKIIDDSKKTGKEYKRRFVIVPESFSHSMEKKFIEKTEGRGLMFTEVLSFSRLSYRLFTELGHSNETVLDDINQNMLIRYLIIKKEKELLYFKNNARINGIVFEITDLIDEFKNYGYDSDDLSKIIESMEKDDDTPASLCMRLRDVCLIFKSYEEYLKEKKMRPSNSSLELLYKLLSKRDDNQKLLPCTLIDGADIYIDGFMGFMYYQFEIIQNLLERCNNVYITFSTNQRIVSGYCDKIFDPVKHTVDRIVKSASEIIDVEDISVEITEKDNSDDSNEFDFLRERLFRRGKKSFNSVNKNIFINSFKTAEDEVKFLIKNIKNILIKEKNNGIHYTDIAIISGDVDNYAHLIKRSFSSHSIPVFIDKKVPLAENVLFRFTSDIIRMIELDLDTSYVCRILKGPFLEFNENEVDELENMLLATGKRGYSIWQKEWTMEGIEPEGQSENKEVLNPDEEDNEFKDEKDFKENPEITRQKFMDIFGEIIKKLHTGKHTIGFYIDNLLTLFDSLKIKEKLESLRSDAEKALDLEKENQFHQAYPILLSLFESMKLLLGDTECTLREFYDIYIGGIERASIGALPEKDGILFGDAVSSKLDSVKYLFVIGTNDCFIPGSRMGGGIINESEREYIASKEFEGRPVKLSPGVYEKNKEDEYKLFINLSKATKKLYISYFMNDAEGKAANPAFVINRLISIFPEAEKSYAKSLPEEILYDDFGKTYLLNSIRNYRAGAQELVDTYIEAVKTGFSEEIIDEWNDKVIIGDNMEKIDKDTIEELYKDKEFSISQLESLAACPYSYLLSYGIGLKERAIHRIDPIIIGNIIHSALNNLVRSMKKNRGDFATFDDDDFSIHANSAFDKTCEEIKNPGLFEGKRGQATLKRFKDVFLRNVYAIREQMKAGNYKTEGSEVIYEIDSPIPLKAVIDRVDTAEGVYEDMKTGEKQDALFIRITDYKTGNKKVSLSDLFYGLQLQMVVYMKSSMEKLEKKAKNKIIMPAGVFYYNIKDDFTENGEEDMRSEGLFEKSPSTIKTFDNSLVYTNGDTGFRYAEKAKSQVIKFTTTKEGEPDSYTKANIVDKEEMEELIRYADRKITELAQKRNNGDIETYPFMHMDNQNKPSGKACDYCLYNSVCGFDKESNGYNVHKDVKNQIALDMIKKSL